MKTVFNNMLRGLTMNSKLWLILLAAIIGCSKAEIPLTPEDPTLLKIIAVNEDGTVVDSADVFINGSVVGKTPFNSQDVQPGLHALRVSRNGYKVYSERVVVEKGEFYNVEAFLEKLPSDKGQLFVTSNLDSTLILVKDMNNNIVAESFEKTLTMELSPGKYLVSGKKTNCPKDEKEARISPENITIINLELALPNNSIPPTLQFAIQEDTVKLGQAIKMIWATNGHQVIIDQSIGIRGPNGSEKYICQSAGLKVFTATSYNKDNLTTSIRDSVYILPVDNQLPTLHFSIEQDSVILGEPYSLIWASDGVKVIIDQSIGTRGPNGSEQMFSITTGLVVFTATAYSSENLTIQKKDSIYVKEAKMPPNPIIMLSATKKVTVNEPATISWQSQNADYVVVDYVTNADISGNHEITFSTPGFRIVTATAFNQSGYTSASDTIEVVVPKVETINDILIPVDVLLRADKGEAGNTKLDIASFEIEKAGKYQIFAEVWYNSGDAQLNESYYIDITNNSGINSSPQDPNAGVYKVIDDEAGAPHTSSKPSGVFYFSTGMHNINAYHYAKIASIYSGFVNGQISGAESVSLLGFKISYIGE